MKLVDINKGKTKVTHKQLLLDHIEKIPAEHADAEVHMMMLVGVTEFGSVYSILHGDDMLQLIGMLDVTKQYVFMDTVEGGYDE